MWGRGEKVPNGSISVGPRALCGVLGDPSLIFLTGGSRSWVDSFRPRLVVYGKLHVLLFAALTLLEEQTLLGANFCSPFGKLLWVVLHPYMCTSSCWGFLCVCVCLFLHHVFSQWDIILPVCFQGKNKQKEKPFLLQN